jgi:hypothetical protein
MIPARPRGLDGLITQILVGKRDEGAPEVFLRASGSSLSILRLPILSSSLDFERFGAPAR